MLRFEILNKNENKTVYRYYPNDGKDYGEVTVNGNGDVIDKVIAVNDPYERHFLHLMDVIKNNSALNGGIIAWY